MNPLPLRSLRVLLLAAVGCADPIESETPDDTGDSGGSTGACVNPASLLLENGNPSGYEQCDDGSINRVASEDFDVNEGLDACGGTEADLRCASDSDCSDGPNGHCSSLLSGDTGLADPSYCGCVYPCENDNDCEGNTACHSTEIGDGTAAFNRCISADCSTGDDCQSGECGLTSFQNGCGWDLELSCRTAKDECRDDMDCDGKPNADQCAPDFQGDGLICQGADCDIGRPLIVGGAERVAPSRPGAGWAMKVEISMVGRTPRDRSGRASRWARVAALEHASIGSFARFTLQLLALGAPAELVLAAQVAAADEVRHARVAYGIASAYAGETLEPARMALADAMPALDPEGVLRGLIDEACVGETLGAAEARAEAEAEPELREIMEQIAEDESRHAALAWQTLKWLLSEYPELRRVAAEQFESTISRHAASRNPVHRAALREVVRPLVKTVVEAAA